MGSSLLSTLCRRGGRLLGVVIDSVAAVGTGLGG